MFRPIKNFINYIQKNASGSAIFGSTTTIADSETEPGAEEIGTEARKSIRIESEATRAQSAKDSRVVEKTVFSKHISEQIANKKMKRIEVNKLNVVECKSATVEVINGNESNGIAVYGGDDCNADDDIELQIKSSVMLRPPIKSAATLVENLTDEVDGDLEDVQSQDSLHDYNDAIGIDSQDEFEYQQEAAEVVSMLSEDGVAAVAGEDTADEFITEEEDAGDIFLELPSDQEQRFEDSEIIVLNDGDINSSTVSDTASEDPLAIDDFTQPTLSVISNPLESSTQDEASTSADLLWITIDDLKTNTTTPNAEKDLPSETRTITPTSTPQRLLPTTTTTCKEKRNSALAASTSATKLSNQRDENAEEIRSDGSDSGLGSETSTLQTTLNSLADTSQLTAPNDRSAANTPTVNKSKVITNNGPGSSGTNVTFTDDAPSSSNAVVPVAVSAALPPLTALTKPLRSNLKRRLEEDDVLIDATPDTQLATIGVGTQVKKLKRSINFENVQVYYFPRQQGFGCVPSAGGCTLGMGARHIGFKTLTLAEHAAELRRAHRLQLQEINPRGSSSDDSEESEEDYLSEGSGSDLDAESNGFLQPVSPKQRRALLKAAGVRKIDAAEKIECRDIRNSREVCGCACVEFCDPETCACSQAGIKCQVDRAMFPCGCTRDACLNTVGRVEFNPTRVRTHFIHTIMRLEMENRQQQNPPLCSTMSSYSLSAACATTAAVVGSHTGALPATPTYANTLPGSYYAMQTQSNYSSGYASPAYPNEPAANYYQQQSASTSTATHYGAVSTNDLQTTSAQQQSFQLDTLDAGLFADSASSATPAYGEMMPAYSSAVGVSASTATVSAYHQNVNYSTQVSTYTAYQQTTSAGAYLPTHESVTATAQTALTPPTTYSSCAVPSLPPYGTATTTAATAEYQDTSSCYALVDTTAPSCISMEDSGGSSEVASDAEVIASASNHISSVASGNTSSGANSTIINATTTNNNNVNSTSCNKTAIGNTHSSLPNDDDGGVDEECKSLSKATDSGGDSNFIQLSTPISSATRLSQINDLLQHNRHTTATLVSVSHTTCLSADGGSSSSTVVSSRSVTTDCDYSDSNSEDAVKCEAYNEVKVENKMVNGDIANATAAATHANESTKNCAISDTVQPAVAADKAEMEVAQNLANTNQNATEETEKMLSVEVDSIATASESTVECTKSSLSHVEALNRTDSDAATPADSNAVVATAVTAAMAVASTLNLVSN
uniref:Cysteine/serine-rich nuclear protein 3 n=1 Tax=Zeugodacus cucurbitae TaxID=28588 RepID=A0A0A1X2F2_ZEUCU